MKIYRAQVSINMKEFMSSNVKVILLDYGDSTRDDLRERAVDCVKNELLKSKKSDHQLLGNKGIFKTTSLSEIEFNFVSIPE